MLFAEEHENSIGSDYLEIEITAFPQMFLLYLKRRFSTASRLKQYFAIWGKSIRKLFLRWHIFVGIVCGVRWAVTAACDLCVVQKTLDTRFLWFRLDSRVTFMNGDLFPGRLYHHCFTGRSWYMRLSLSNNISDLTVLCPCSNSAASLSNQPVHNIRLTFSFLIAKALGQFFILYQLEIDSFALKHQRSVYVLNPLGLYSYKRN